LADVKKNMARITGAGAQVAAISVDTVKQSAAFKRTMRLPFELLCDTDKQVIKQYHLLNTSEHDGIAFPAVFVITPSGKIVYRSLDRTAKRVKFDVVLDFLDRLAEDPSYTETNASPMTAIIPSPSALAQVMRNMAVRGSLGDWKHYVKFTVVEVPRGMYRTVTRIFKKG
jgi:hypothetical protein